MSNQPYSLEVTIDGVAATTHYGSVTEANRAMSDLYAANPGKAIHVLQHARDNMVKNPSGQWINVQGDPNGTAARDRDGRNDGRRNDGQADDGRRDVDGSSLANRVTPRLDREGLELNPDGTRKDGR